MPGPILDVGQVVFNTGVTDDHGVFTDDTESYDQYTDYVINNRYERDFHRFMLPLTTPNKFRGAMVGFVQLAAPTLLWIADWTAARCNTPPEIPSPLLIVGILKKYSAEAAILSDDWIILDDHLETGGITDVAADGQIPNYRISGTYYYGCRDPSEDLYRDAIFGLAPFLQRSRDGAFKLHRRIPDEVVRGDILLNQGDG